MKKIKRQALNVSIKELKRLCEDLTNQEKALFQCLKLKCKRDEDHKWVIPIINKTPECSDTWRIEK